MPCIDSNYVWIAANSGKDGVGLHCFNNQELQLTYSTVYRRALRLGEPNHSQVKERGSLDLQTPRGCLGLRADQMPAVKAVKAVMDLPALLLAWDSYDDLPLTEIPPGTDQLV